MPKPEFAFSSTSPGDVKAALYAQGCVLLRGFVERDRIPQLRDDIESVGYDETNLLFFNHFIDAGFRNFHEYIFDNRHHALLRALGPQAIVTGSTVARNLQSTGYGGWTNRLFPHIDGFFGLPNSVVNFWIALDPCGGDAPTLGVIPAPFSEIVEFVGFDGSTELSPDRWSSFIRSMKDMAEVGQGPGMDAYNERFGPRLWAPNYEPGDCMMFTSWTLHQTCAELEMTRGRRNLELRFDVGTPFMEGVAAAAANTQSRRAPHCFESI